MLVTHVSQYHIDQSKLVTIQFTLTIHIHCTIYVINIGTEAEQQESKYDEDDFEEGQYYSSVSPCIFNHSTHVHVYIYPQNVSSICTTLYSYIQCMIIFVPLMLKECILAKLFACMLRFHLSRFLLPWLLYVT